MSTSREFPPAWARNYFKGVDIAPDPAVIGARSADDPAVVALLRIATAIAATNPSAANELRRIAQEVRWTFREYSDLVDVLMEDAPAPLTEFSEVGGRA